MYFKRSTPSDLQVCLGLMVLSGLGGAYAILFYAKSIFESAGISGSVGSIAMGLIQLPPAVPGVLLMDKFGRRPLLMCSAAGMGIGTLSLASSFSLKEHGLMTDFRPYLALFGILRSISSRNGWHTICYNVGDIPHKHQGCSRNFVNGCQLRDFLDHIILV